MRQYLVNYTAQPYFSALTTFVRDQYLTLESMLEKCSNGRLSFRNIEDYSADQLDDLYYLNDIFNMRIEGLSAVLNEELQKNVIRSLLIDSIIRPPEFEESHDESQTQDGEATNQNETNTQVENKTEAKKYLSKATAIFSMSQIFLIFADPIMIRQIAEVILLPPDADYERTIDAGQIVDDCNIYRDCIFDAISSNEDECLTCAALSLFYTIICNKETPENLLDEAGVSPRRQKKTHRLLDALTDSTTPDFFSHSADQDIVLRLSKKSVDEQKSPIKVTLAHKEHRKSTNEPQVDYAFPIVGKLFSLLEHGVRKIITLHLIMQLLLELLSVRSGSTKVILHESHVVQLRVRFNIIILTF
jgi:hypothetical protein